MSNTRSSSRRGEVEAGRHDIRRSGQCEHADGIRDREGRREARRLDARTTAAGHRQLEAARKSLWRQIDLHKGWIENPQSKVVDWEARPPRYKVGLIKKWHQDISRQAEQVNIIDGVMKEQGYE